MRVYVRSSQLPTAWVKNPLVIRASFLPAVTRPTFGGQARLLGGLRKTSAGDGWGGEPWGGKRDLGDDGLVKEGDLFASLKMSSVSLDPSTTAPFPWRLF